ncbi:hypothetical protein EST38_g4022 [Candolleomyces aberdarensis]|uniref:Uncharacterized protein n=1 Tax=Candolleomyces aberdarensis TaxID=2316362 RepID=A0A4Q2DRK5_9AGAR|nr:hypothetical protein EST38_g4022 [Candolleomyces aberdarensis]
MASRPRPSASSLAMDEIKRRRIASLLDPIIEIHQNAITPDTPTRGFPSMNAIRISEAGSFVWTSTSHENVERDLEHDIGFIGSEYIGCLGEGVLRFFMTYGEGRNRHAPRVGELLVPDIYTLQSCGFEAGKSSWTEVRRFITEEMILNLLKRSVETKRRIVLVVVPVDERIAELSENRTLRSGQWILEAKFLPVLMSEGQGSEGRGKWDAHPMFSEAALHVRTFDERAVPCPPIPEDVFPPGNCDGEVTECMRKSLETLEKNGFYRTSPQAKVL